MTDDELRRGAGKNAPELIRKLKEMQDAGTIFTLEQAAAYPKTIPVCCSSIAAVPGSAGKWCAVCRTRVWCAPSTQALIAARGASRCVVVCEKCVTGEQEKVTALLSEADEKTAAGLREPQPPPSVQ